MSFLNYYIRFKNWIGEGQDVEIQVQDLATLTDPPGDTVEIELEGKDGAVLMDSVTNEDDKTEAVKGRRLTFGFNSGNYDVGGTDTVVDVGTFSDGDDGRFRVRLGTGAGPTAVPFIGSLVLDDNSEAFQPRPNPVQLRAGEGFGSLKDSELRDGDEIAVGHYAIIDYFVMILDRLITGQDIHVVMNLFEVDTDPDVTHAFTDTYVNALTFETDVDKREDCFTVLIKICEAFGCFITHDNDGWWIIRWDEYDKINNGALTLRVANFTNAGVLQNYTLENVSKRIAHDQDVLYEGYFMSFDSALRRYQRKAKSVTHEYKYEQPKEVPCNAGFTRGTVDDDVLPLKTYDPECWTLKNGVPGSYGSTTSEMRIGVRFDVNGVETERFLYLTPTASSQLFEYAESEPIDVHEKDKFEVSVNWRTESIYPSAYGGLYSRMIIYLRGDDGSDWLLGNTTLSDPTTPRKWWDTSNFTVNTSAGHIDLDSTLIEEQEWQSQDIDEVPEIPVDGKIYIWLHQGNQSGATSDDDGIAIDYADLRFNYIPLVGGTYRRVNGHSHKVTGDNDSRKEITHQMYLGDSPKKLFKGALKKFDGTNYILTETWDYYNETGVLGGGVQLGKHIVFQWWQQFRKTRTIIETDVQGLNSDEATGIPGMIHKWAINHGGQEAKWFMLTSFRNMDFYKCGWQGVFVEMSDSDGDRYYDDTYLFSYIYGG